MSVRRGLGLTLCLLLLAACGTSAPGVSVAPSPSTAAVPTPTAQALSTAPPPMSAAPTPTGTSVASAPTPTLSPDERVLVARLRNDVVDCVPRRADLPPRATAGVECRTDSELVARVGVYGFSSTRDAALTYLERLAAAGVDPATGQCQQGKAGDRAWIPGDGEGTGDDPDNVAFDGQILRSHRSGCFLDENGIANFRSTCGDGRYVGVLGRTPDLAAVESWTWAYPEGESVDTPTPPGICKPGG